MKYRIRNTVTGGLVDSPYFTMNRKGDIVTLREDEMCTVEYLQAEMFTGLEDSNGVEVYEGDIIAEVDGQYWSVEFGSFGDHKFYAVNGINSCRELEEDLDEVISFNIKGDGPTYVSVIGVRYCKPCGGIRKEVIELN